MRKISPDSRALFGMSRRSQTKKKSAEPMTTAGLRRVGDVLAP